MNLAEFLLARVEDDEYEAYDHYSNHDDGADVEGAQCVHNDGPHPCRFRRRILAECEAKRQMLQDRDVNPLASEYIRKLLAVPYADHPDYRQEWKP